MRSRRLLLLAAAVATLQLQFMQRSTSFFGRLIPSALPRQARFVSVDVARVPVKPGIQPELRDFQRHSFLSAALPSALAYQAGVATKAGYVQGMAKVNQDACAATEDLLLVCDGHGKSGEVVSRTVAQVLPRILSSGKTTEEGLRAAFLAMDAEIEKIGPTTDRAGSTAVAVIISPSKLVTAYVGDSRAILGRRAAKNGLWEAIPLSGVHKPDMPEEAERILAAGGTLTRTRFGPARVNGLAMSRAFGDFDVKAAGVIVEPGVNVHDLRPTDEVVIVGSDGVWDVLDQSEVLALLEPHWATRDAKAGAQAIVDAARDVWQESSHGYGDDITCVVAWLQ
jgi:serine/threonine protein phosphatase PrpC